MYKIKPSLLESYRLIRDGEFEKDINEFHDQIKGIFKPTDKMQFGTLVHHYLETGNPEKGELKLFDKEVEQLHELRNESKAFMNEVRFTFNLDCFLVSCAIDRVSGLMGEEIKTGSRYYGVDFYENSVQWKLYCMGLNLHIFKYTHIQYNSVRPYNFNINRPEFFPYPGMYGEVLMLCHNFLEYCRLNELEKYIKIK